MKGLLLSVLLLLCIASHAQSNPQNIYGAGISFNQAASPSVSGTALYARIASDNLGTYAFTAIDVLQQSKSPFTVNTNVSVGVAQKVFTLGKIPVYAPTSAGVSFNGSNTGWVWTTGAMASIKLKNDWKLFPNVRIAKSSVSGNSGYQPIIGFMVGWGK